MNTDQLPVFGYWLEWTGTTNAKISMIRWRDRFPSL